MTGTEPVASPVLELSGVTAAYGRTTVLREIDLTVPPGTVVALLGPNGAGKTTLLRCASGLLKPTEGEIRIGGLDMTRSNAVTRARAGVCLVPEGRGIFHSLSVLENLRLQVPPWAQEADLDRAFGAFPVLYDRRRQRSGTLSGGEQQMLALARCFLSAPSLVLLDEVSMGLAPRIVEQIFESIMSLAGEGVSLLLVEQYVNRALEMSDLIYLLDRGRITHSGAASTIDEDDLVSSYLGEGATATRVDHRRQSARTGTTDPSNAGGG